MRGQLQRGAGALHVRECAADAGRKRVRGRLVLDAPGGRGVAVRGGLREEASGSLSERVGRGQIKAGRNSDLRLIKGTVCRLCGGGGLALIENVDSSRREVVRGSLAVSTGLIVGTGCSLGVLGVGRRLALCRKRALAVAAAHVVRGGAVILHLAVYVAGIRVAQVRSRRIVDRSFGHLQAAHAAAYWVQALVQCGSVRHAVLGNLVLVESAAEVGVQLAE